MIVKVENMEIRGVEKKVSKKNKGEYLVVRVEDTTGRGYELLDREIGNMQYYSRGVQCNLTLDLILGSKYTSLNIVGMEVCK